MAKAAVSSTFHTGWRRATKFKKVGSQTSGCSIVIDFQVMDIHTGWYARHAGQEAQEEKVA
jgi:hypothetical protein